MQTKGWCYRHNCPMQMVPLSGIWQYVCPKCVKEIQTYYATKATVSTGKTLVRDMTVNSVPEEVSRND